MCRGNGRDGQEQTGLPAQVSALLGGTNELCPETRRVRGQQLLQAASYKQQDAWKELKPKCRRPGRPGQPQDSTADTHLRQKHTPKGVGTRPHCGALLPLPFHLPALAAMAIDGPE